MSAAPAEPRWEAIARSPRFQELIAAKRRFVIRATAFYTLYFTAFLALLGFAPDFMARQVAGLSLALWGGLSVCALAVIMAVIYMRRADGWDVAIEELER